MGVTRRQLLVVSVGLTAFSRSAFADNTLIELMTAGEGSGFLDYGTRLAKAAGDLGIMKMAVRQTKGSIENLQIVDSDAGKLGMSVLGSAYVQPGSATQHPNVRALFAMYETAYMVAALKSSGLTGFHQLGGKKVGVGPQGGPLERTMRTFAQSIGVAPAFQNGSPSQLGRQLVAGEIDALIQAANVPIPSLKAVADEVETTVFGFAQSELAALKRLMPYAVEMEVPPLTYRGQVSAIATMAVWNVVIAHKDFPEARAYALTKGILHQADVGRYLGEAGKSTRAENAPLNTILPYHIGAARALAEMGIKVEAR